MPFDNSTSQFQVLGTRSGGLSLLPQQKVLLDVGDQNVSVESMDTAASDRSPNTNDKLRYVQYSIFPASVRQC